MTSATQARVWMADNFGQLLTTCPDYWLKLDRFEREALQLRGMLASSRSPSVGPASAHILIECARFANRAKLAFPRQSKLFNTMANLKTDWPANWHNFADLSAHIERAMIALRKEV